MSYGVGRRRGSDLSWLWLWRRMAATALIRPLAPGTFRAMGVGVALTNQKKKKKKK